MVLAGRTKLRVSKNFFGGYLFVFVEYLCKRSPKIKTKNIKNYSSILAIVNHRNWLDDSPPLRSCFKFSSFRYRIFENYSNEQNCSVCVYLDLDDCSPNPCLNEGLCKDAGASRFICFCGDGFSGDTCETSTKFL